MNRLGAEYFEKIYAGAADPWGFADRWYERRKYALTLAALPREKYRRGFEPGCSFGELSDVLAARCEHLVCYELVPEVADRARRRLASRPHVEVFTDAIPETWPAGTFDLIVLSEVGYYLTASGANELAAHVDTSLEAGGHLVAVHYRLATDYPRTGDQVHEMLRRELRDVRVTSSWVESEFRLDVFERRGP